MRSSYIFSLILFFTLVFTVNNTFSSPLSLEAAAGKTVSSISISGNKKTKDKIILRELLIDENQPLNIENAQTSLQRLKNLRIFERVDFVYVENADQTIDVQITIKDRWTIIPIIKVGGGGGSTFYTVGTYDVNTMGKYLETGGQYQNVNGKNGGVVWFRNPRFLNKRLLLGMDIWHFMLNQPTYDLNGDLYGTYNNTKNRIHLFTKFEINTGLFFGAGLDIVEDKFDDFGLTDEQEIANNKVSFELPEDTKQNFVELNGQLGELNYDQYLVSGQQTNIDMRITQKNLGSDDNSVEVVGKFTYFARFPHRQNIGINVVAGHSNTRFLQNYFFLGGLSEVRGYVDRRFKGTNFWRSSVEYRIPSYRSKYFILQHVVFTDFGQISNDAANLLSNKSNEFTSVGTGLRFIAPKIYRFNARLDLAQTFGDTDNLDFSFGLQQFF